MNFNRKSIFENRSILQSYYNKVRKGDQLTNEDEDKIMRAFYRIHDKLFDTELKFKDSEITQAPIQVSYHQLNKILFLYFLQKMKEGNLSNNISKHVNNNANYNLNANQSAQVIIDKFNALKYSPSILLYFWWLTDDFYPNTIENTIRYLKSNIGQYPNFKNDYLNKYGIQTLKQLGNKRIKDMPFHNLINLVLVFGKYLDDNKKNSNFESNEEAIALSFYQDFIAAENKMQDLLAKYTSNELDLLNLGNGYSTWEEPLYRNYYFRYVIYLAEFYDVGYNDLNGYFQREQYFTYRKMNNHILLTGFDPINITDNEYIISDTDIRKDNKSLHFHNITQRVDVNIKQTLIKLNKNNSSSLLNARDKGEKNWIMTYDNNRREFLIRLPTISNSNRRRRSRKRINQPAPTNTNTNTNEAPANQNQNKAKAKANAQDEIQSIRIKIASEQIGGSPKTVLEVYLNDTFLYVFFKQGKFFRLMRRCDQQIIGSITEDINGFQYFKDNKPDGMKVGKQKISFCQVNMIFPFEFVVFNYCCQALVSEYSQKLDTIASRFFRQVTQVFAPKPQNQAEKQEMQVETEKGKRVSRKCLFVYSKYPYLKQEYLELMASK